jgi:hypothetical protein
MQTSETVSHTRPTKKPTHLRFWLLLLGINFVFIAVDLFTPSLVFQVLGRPFIVLLSMYEGALTAQIALLGAVMALSTERFVLRLAVILGMLLMDACAVLTGMWIAGMSTAYGPRTVIVVAMTRWLAIWFAFAYIRSYAGWQIGSSNERRAPDRLTILGVMAATASVAGTLAVFNWLLSSKLTANSIASFSISLLYWMTLTAPMVGCGLGQRLRVKHVLLLLSGALTLSPATCFVQSYVDAFPLTLAALTAHAVKTLGFLAFTGTAILILRKFGYRLREVA